MYTNYANLTPVHGAFDYVNVWGTDSPDTLYASPYGLNTHIYAGGGDDTVHGGNGNDLIVGGAGADHLFGGAGADTFVWNNLAEFAGRADSIAFGDGTDMILDFNPLEGDTIDLTGLAQSGGFQHLTFEGEHNPTTSFGNTPWMAPPGSVYWEQTLSGANSYNIFVSLHGGAPDAAITVDNLSGGLGHPDASWFHL